MTTKTTDSIKLRYVSSVSRLNVYRSLYNALNQSSSHLDQDIERSVTGHKEDKEHKEVKDHKEVKEDKEVAGTAVMDKPTVMWRYKRLAACLSACMVAQMMVLTDADAADITTDTVEKPATYDTLTTDTDGLMTDDESLDEALVALKLKQAVEQGLIDPSVLEDYKRETLAKPKPAKPINNTSVTEDLASSTSSGDDILDNDQANQHPSAALSAVTDSTTAQQASTQGSDFEASIGNAFADDRELVEDTQVLQSPLEIEQALSQITDDDLNATEFDEPVATLDSSSAPLGFDKQLDDITVTEPDNRQTLGLNREDLNTDGESFISANTNSPQANNITTDDDSVVSDTDDLIDSTNASSSSINSNVNSSIDPSDYLPEYVENSGADDAVESAVIDSDASKDAADEVGFFKGIYNRLFNDGYSSLPRLKADIYMLDDSRSDAAGKPVLIEADDKTQPASNIKAAMENITVEAVSDFTAALPKLMEEAQNAAKAVGYYDTKIRFNRKSTNTIDVIIEQLGEPVTVKNRLVDIRGEGADLPEYEAIKAQAQPLQGDVFNHGEYKKVKALIEETEDKHGYFDAQWLNSSVDVILPDDTADVDLIYDTGERYRFDEVVFFTIDKDTGKLTFDPDKLPVKPELLHQLYDFKSGDAFYRPKITSFTNDLSATKYFNLVNVDVVRPLTGIGTLGFNNEDAESENEQMAAESANESAEGEQTGGGSLTNEGSAKIGDEIKPIEFAIDDETSAKLQAIKDKADRLISLPDNRVLDENPEEAKNLLGKISNAISNTVAKILPKEDEDLAPSENRIEDFEAALREQKKTPQEVAQTKSVPLYVFVMADEPRDVDFGIGYGSDTGVRAVARFEHNLINREGYQAGISIGASKADKSLDIHASRPWKHPLNDKLLGNISYEQEERSLGDDKPNYTVNTVKAGVARNIRKDEGWNRSYSLAYRLDRIESDATDLERQDMPYPFNVRSAKFNQQSLLAGYAMDKTTTDNVTNPSKGWRQYYSVEAGAKGALTDTNMAILRAGVDGIYSFGEYGKHQLLGSVDAGYIWADNIQDVPFQQRFYAGGDRSIRGYDYNSLSAQDEKGNLIGGEVLALGSAEYNYEFKPGLRGAVFADVGNAYDANFETDTKLGVGVGVRWASPVGMVRLDLAAGVLEESIPVRLHFFIGSPLQ